MVTLARACCGLVVLLLVAAPASADASPSPCTAAKLKCVGKKSKALLACHARAVAHGTAVDDRCVAAAQQRFQDPVTGCFASAERRSACLTTGDALAVEATVDAQVVAVVAALVPTTTSTSSTTTTTLGTCCPAGRMRFTGDTGVATWSTLGASTIAAGMQLTLDVGPPAGSCRHDVTVPPGGFFTPGFCVFAYNMTVQITPLGCAAGGNDGGGGLWDGDAACADADALREGDTSDGVCNPAGQPCNNNLSGGGAGANELGNVDASRGDAVCDDDGVHLRVDVPVRVFAWINQDGVCPDAAYDAGVDLPVSDFTTVLSLTTATARAAFVDQNFDLCKRAGAGPDATRVCSTDPGRPCSRNEECTSGTCMTGTLQGAPAAGPCCTLGQAARLVASTPVFSGGYPFSDFLFSESVPVTVTACGSYQGSGSCTVTADPCAE